MQQGGCEDLVQSLLTAALVNFGNSAQHLLWFMAAAAGTDWVHAPTAANEKAPVGLLRLLSVLRCQVRQNTLRVPYAVSRRAGGSHPTPRMSQPFPIRLWTYKGRRLYPELYSISSVLSLPVLCHPSCQCKSDML